MRVLLLFLGFLAAGISAADTDTKYILNQDIESTEIDNIETKWLTDINRLVVKNAIIDINLYDIGKVENCFIKPPDADMISFNDVDDEADIKLYPPSKFVSCRCIVGPMKEELLGKWIIVGIHKKDGISYVRKQNVILQWLNPNNPVQERSIKNEDLVKYVVHFGFSITPVIFTHGSVSNCYIITPNGEEITLLKDSKYPNITLLDSTILDCSIKLRAIHSNMIGDWTILTESRDIVVKRPIHLYLYDEDNPYDQSYNRTYLGPNKHIVHLNNTITVEVISSKYYDKDECYVQRPNGDIQILEKGFDFNGVKLLEEQTNTASCQISIGPINKQMLGKWRLIGKFSGRALFHEIIHLFTIIEEDPSNPSVDPNRKVELLDEISILSDLHTTHEFTIPSDYISPNETDTCHIITPDGLQYKFLETFNVPGVEIIRPNSKISCGVFIKIMSENQVGNWTLISRETRFSELIERRLPIKILVEEFVNTSPQKEVLISRGNDFYIRLEAPTDLYATCQLIPPNGFRNYELDNRFADRCGYIVKGVNEEDSGVWEIKYGPKIIYRAQLIMTVLAPPPPIVNSLQLKRFRPVNMTIGPENSIFCRVIAPSGRYAFNGFGVCRIVIANVGGNDGGMWRLFITLPGSMTAIRHDVNVTTVNPAPPPVVKGVSSFIDDSSPSVIISCSATLPNEIRSCKLRQPNGKILTPALGLGEGRYSFHGEGTRFYLNQYHADCGIRINNLSSFDASGIWRCAFETKDQTYFGFINVPQTYLTKDSDKTYDIRAVPLYVSTLEGEMSQMLCQINAPIAYCYFRHENGTVINLSPGRPSENYEYFGDGLEAGDCGLSIRKTSLKDYGQWTCNIGPRDFTISELHKPIFFNVETLFTFEQYLLFDFSMELGGCVGGELEYCRFVRSDGLGFTLNNLPAGYTPLPGGCEICGLSVRYPSAADRDSWTIAFKIRGQLHEISVQTASVNNSNIGVPAYVLIILYIVIVFLSFLVVSAMLTFLLPRKNRERTFARVMSIRDSITNSLRKRPAEFNAPIVHSNASENNSAPSA